MVNLLCDRSLEAAYASRLRIIDGPLIQTAARALGVGEQAAPAAPAAGVNATARSTEAETDESPWTFSQSESESPDNAVQPADEPVPAGSSARTRPQSILAPVSAWPSAKGLSNAMAAASGLSRASARVRHSSSLSLR